MEELGVRLDLKVEWDLLDGEKREAAVASRIPAGP